MIDFNELYITQEGDKLVIDASVINSTYYNDIYIDKIIIDTQDTFTNMGPSESPVYQKTIEGDIKTIREEINKLDILSDLNTNLFFVYIVAKGTPSVDTPCGKDNMYVLNSVINLYPIYQKSLGYLKELNNCCEIPKGFIDYNLKFKALDIFIKTGNYNKAIEYWNKFFKDNTVVINNCNCYGNT